MNINKSFHIFTQLTQGLVPDNVCEPILEMAIEIDAGIFKLTVELDHANETISVLRETNNDLSMRISELDTEINQLRAKVINV